MSRYQLAGVWRRAALLHDRYQFRKSDEATKLQSYYSTEHGRRMEGAARFAALRM